MGLASDIVKVIFANVFAFFGWLIVSFAFGFTTNVSLFIVDKLSEVAPDVFGGYRAQFAQNINDTASYGSIWNLFPIIVGIASFLWLLMRAKKSDEVEVTQYYTG